MTDLSLAQKVDAQRAYFNRGLTLTPAHRLNALKQLQTAIKTQHNEIISALQEDMAKPATEAYLSEISPVLHEIAFALKHLRRWQKTRRVRTPFYLLPAASHLYHEPFGVCLIIAPWNYPFSLSLQPLVSALAAGNCVTVKPSRQAPATARLLQKMLTQLFSPEFVRVAAENDHDALLDQTWDFIFFTGGTTTGKTVMQAAAQKLTPVVLELGGKSPCIIDAGLTDLKTAAKRIMWGKFFNAGQTCIAPDYVLVPAERKSELLAHFSRALEQMYGGKAPVLGTNYTRIINAKQWQKLNQLLVQEQEKLVWGGDAREEDLYLGPALFDNVSWDSPLMQTEIFGPLLPLVSYSSLPELLDKLRQMPKPLALYVFSQNKSFIANVTQKISFGGGCVNATLLHYSNPHLPFGGAGLSGMGRYHGRYGFEAFSRVKPVLHKARWSEPNLPYQPYTSAKLKLLKKLF